MRICGLALALSLLAGLSAQVAAAYDAGEMYDPGTVVFIDLTLSPAAEAELEADPEEYVDGTFSLTLSSDGTPDGEEASPVLPPRAAEIRLKGSEGGSFRDLTEKAAFKLKFKKLEAFLGLRKMTLNNMVQDPSMLHETLAYASFRAAGVPASRTGYAYVRLNGEDIGVYLNLENLDDIGLSRIFGSTFDQDTQHLYEGEYGDDVVPDGAADFEVDEGGDEPDEIGDLEALIEAVNSEGDASWSDRVAPNADLAEMAKMWAVEKYIDHWDGYAGHAIPGFRPNNYYLYSDPSGRFQMLPWGTDQAWVFTEGGREVTFDGEGGVLFNKCLEDEQCFRAYWTALNGVTQAVPGIDPVVLAEDTADLLAPWQEDERDNGRPDPAADEADEVEDGVEETLEFAAGRQAEAEDWLAANEPPPIPDSPFSPPTAKDPTSVTAPALLFVQSGRTARWITARLRLSGPGQVGLRATMRTRKGMKRACASSTRAGAAGELAVGCKLSRAALRRLNRGALRLELTFTLTLADGRTETLVRRIRLPRSPRVGS
jgi:hypothetical protein